MPVSTFVRENVVLVVGLVLPVVMMAGFLLASSLPVTVGDPPRYDLVFTVQDYPPTPNIPVSVRLVVKQGVLTAQYARLPLPPGGYASAGWKKLYVFEASSRTVRQLSFGFPADMDAIEGTREDVVEATAKLRLDTTLQAPDGYELAYGSYARGGLLSDVFFGSRGYTEPRLRKGSSSVPLQATAGQPAFAYGAIEFVGWVTARN